MKRLALAFAALTASSACGDKKTDAASDSVASAPPGSATGADGPRTVPAASAPAASAPAASASAPPASGESTGVAECDRFLEKFSVCFPDMAGQIDQFRAAYRQSSAFGAQLAETCKQQLSALENCTPGAPIGMPPGTGGSPFPLPLPASAAPGGAEPTECHDFFVAVQCMIDKVPAGSRTSADQMMAQARSAITMLGSAAAPYCKQALDMQADALRMLGCAPGSEAPPTVSGTAPLPPVPTATAGGTSAVPTLDEWDAVTREVAVRGSTALHCETKMVREWLRVSCRNPNGTGGSPSGVTVLRGGDRASTFEFAAPGDRTSLVTRFVPGVDVWVRFTWSDMARELHVHWPRGAPEPEAKGEFLAP